MIEGAPVAELVSSLVIEADGMVVPLAHGFPRGHALGNLGAERFRAIVRSVAEATAGPLAGPSSSGPLAGPSSYRRMPVRLALVVAVAQTCAAGFDGWVELEGARLMGCWRRCRTCSAAHLVGNVVGKPDRRGNLYPAKPRPEQKIDAAVALMMAVGRAMAEDANEGDLDDFLRDPVIA